MKRIIKWLFAIVLLLPALAGCNQSSNEGKETTSGDSTDEEITLELWSWDAIQAEGVQSAIDAFEEQNPNIKVNFENIPTQGGNEDYMLKLEAAVEAGNTPDVFWMNTTAEDYAAAGVIQPLDDFIEADGVDLKGSYNETIVDIYNYNDQQYAIPKDMDASFIVYNTKIFDELGVDHPEADWTWDDFVETGRQLKEGMEDNQFPLYYRVNAIYGPSLLTVQQGGSYVEEAEDGSFTANFDTDEYKKALTTLYDLQEEGLSPHYVENSDYDYLGSMISGGLAMATIPSWEIPALAEADVEDGTFAAIPYPSFDGSNTTDTNGLSYVMSANTEHAEAAWKLIKFLTSDEGAQVHAENNGSIPANNNEDVKSAWIESNSAVANLECVNDISANSHFRETNRYPAIRPGLNVINENVYPLFFGGEIDVNEAAKQSQDIVADELS